MSQALKNRITKLERLAIPDLGLRVHVFTEGETAPATSGVKGTLMVTLANDLQGIPVVYEEVEPLNYNQTGYA